MSIVELNSCKIHTYRNTNSMISFDVSDEFIFIISNLNNDDSSNNVNYDDVNYDDNMEFWIHQYVNVTNKGRNISPINVTYKNVKVLTEPLKAKIPFRPVFSSFNNGKYVLASKNELFYFKYDLFSIGRINPLSMTFFYEDLLISVDCKDMTIYKQTNSHYLPILQNSNKSDNLNIKNDENNTGNHDIENDGNNVGNSRCSVQLMSNITIKNLNSNLQPINNQDLSNICSASCIFDDQLYLGFEDGSVGAMPVNYLYSKSSSVDMKILECFKDPVLTIVVDERFIFIQTLTSIFRIPKNDDSDGIYTMVRAIKMLKHTPFLILFQKNELIFMDFDLKIKKVFHSVFEIRDCKILGEDSMFLGFKNGLLVEFSLSKISRLIHE